MSDSQKDVFVEQATFGAGCFWGAEASFRALPGVLDSRVGFASPAGDEAVSIEVVQVDFDTREIPYSRLIEHFWTLHDPTSVDRQGADVGVKYRSALFRQFIQCCMNFLFQFPGQHFFRRMFYLIFHTICHV